MVESIHISIEDIADLIRAMTPEQRLALADVLEHGGAPRCPAKPKGPCVRREHHALPHVDAEGYESLIALKCRIGATKDGAVCSRIDGHRPPCDPLPQPVHVVVDDKDAPGPRPARPWGVCLCGGARQAHEGGTGGCEATDCTKYRSARTHGKGR